LSSNSFRQLKLFLPEIFPATLHEKIAMHAASMLRHVKKAISFSKRLFSCEKSNKFLKEIKMPHTTFGIMSFYKFSLLLPKRLLKNTV